METFDYTFAWIVYLVAAFPLCFIVWKFLKRKLWRGLAYFLQGLLLSLVFTPWYVLADQEILAPAAIIFMMDSITISPEEGIRALIPLVMTMLLAVIISIVMTIVYRVKHKNQRKRVKPTL